MPASPGLDPNIVNLFDPKETNSPLDKKALRSYGIGLILNATGHQYLIEKDDNFVDLNGTADKVALLPGTTQIGGLVSTKYLGPSLYNRPFDDKRLKTAQDQDADISVRESREGGLLVDDEGYWNSYGQIFSPLQPADSVSFSIMATILIAAFNAAAQLLFGLYNLGDDEKENPAQRLSNSIRKKNISKAAGSFLKNQADLGSNTGVGKFVSGLTNLPVLRNLFGRYFYLPKNKYNDCLARGSATLFGDYIKPNTVAGGSVEGAKEFAENLLQVFESPVYYFILMRGVIRSLIMIADELMKLKDVSGVLSGLDKFIKILQVIGRSKFVQMLNIIVMLGDRIIDAEKQGLVFPKYSAQDGPEDQTIKKDSELTNALENNPFARVGLSREPKTELDLGVQRMTYRVDSLPSLYMIPEQHNANTSFKKTISEDLSRVIVAPSTTGGDLPRLPYEEVEKIENQLEAEYLPFYFHDLRTNEIVAFHAFFEEDISINTTVSWNKIDGIGRYDSVRIYNKTEKSFGLSFSVLATEAEDLSKMMWKLSKLESMCWPSRSRGSVVTDDTNTFIQPFSQIQRHSPLIRLRVGNLLKSNFNKLGLMNLFGIRLDKDGKVAGPVKLQGQSTDEIRNLSNEEENALKKGDVVYYGDNFTELQEFIVESIKENTIATIYPKSAKNGYIAPATIPSFSGSGTRQVFGNGRDVSVESLKKKVTIISPKSVDEFLNPEDNLITQSFKSTAGRGIAGCIESFNITFRRDTWDTAYGVKLPWMAKVSIQFSPIHDLPPGIADDGFLYSPTYSHTVQDETLYGARELQEKKQYFDTLTEKTKDNRNILADMVNMESYSSGKTSQQVEEQIANSAISATQGV